MPVEGRPTRIHDLLRMVYDNGGAMVLPNYGMDDEEQLDELPNHSTVEEHDFDFDELMELTSLAEQAELLGSVIDLVEDRTEKLGEEDETAPVTTLYALTAEGTAVAREEQAAPAPTSDDASDTTTTRSGDVDRALVTFAGVLVLVAAADAARRVVLEVVPVEEAAATAGILTLYGLAFAVVIRTYLRIGGD